MARRRTGGGRRGIFRGGGSNRGRIQRDIQDQPQAPSRGSLDEPKKERRFQPPPRRREMSQGTRDSIVSNFNEQRRAQKSGERGQTRQQFFERSDSTITTDQRRAQQGKLSQKQQVRQERQQGLGGRAPGSTERRPVELRGGAVAGRRGADGRISLVDQEVELDPIKRARQRLEEDKTRALGNIERGFDEGKGQLLAGKKTLTGGFTTQTLSNLADMKRRKNRSAEDVEFQAGRGFEDILIQEKAQQQQIEQQEAARQADLADPKKQLQRSNEEAMLNRVQQVMQEKGVDSLQAQRIVQDQIKNYGTQEEIQVDNDFRALMQAGDVNFDVPSDAFSQAYQMHGQDIGKATKMLKSIAGNAYADNAEREFLQSMGMDSDTIEQGQKMRKIKETREQVLSGGGDEGGMAMLSLANTLKKEDPSGTLQSQYLHEILASPETNSTERRIAENMLFSSMEKKDIEDRFLSGELQPEEAEAFLQRRMALSGKTAVSGGGVGGIGGGVAGAELTPQERLQAKGLSVALYGKRAGAKPENINEIMALMGTGQTVDDIDDMLRKSTASDQFSGHFKDAFGFVASNMSDKKAEQNKNVLDRLLEEGKTGKAKDFLTKLARDSASSEEAKSAVGRDDAIIAMDNIDDLLAEYERKGGETALLSGKTEKWRGNVFGSTGDPELAEIANKIKVSIQVYRKAVSGAAFTESEAKEYEQIFPNIENTPELNRALMDSMRDVFSQNQENFYSRELGSAAYDELFTNKKFQEPAPEQITDKSLERFDVFSINKTSQSLPQEDREIFDNLSEDEKRDFMGIPAVQKKKVTTQSSQAAAIKQNAPTQITNLLDTIGGVEAGGNYNAIFGDANNTEDFSQKTISEIQQIQRDHVAGGQPSSAIGKYQFIQGTLAGVVEEMGLDPETTEFTPELQDEMAIHLLKRRGLDQFLSGEMSEAQFQQNLSKEWASLPKDSGGQSFYAGDGLNKSLISSPDFLASLGQIPRNTTA